MLTNQRFGFSCNINIDAGSGIAFLNLLRLLSLLQHEGFFADPAAIVSRASLSISSCTGTG